MLRLAGSEPAMWEQIAASNQQNMAAALESMEAKLRTLRQSLGSPEFRQKFRAGERVFKVLKELKSLQLVPTRSSPIRLQAAGQRWLSCHSKFQNVIFQYNSASKSAAGFVGKSASSE